MEGVMVDPDMMRVTLNNDAVVRRVTERQIADDDVFDMRKHCALGRVAGITQRGIIREAADPETETADRRRRTNTDNRFVRTNVHHRAGTADRAGYLYNTRHVIVQRCLQRCIRRHGNRLATCAAAGAITINAVQRCKSADARDITLLAAATADAAARGRGAA